VANAPTRSDSQARSSFAIQRESCTYTSGGCYDWRLSHVALAPYAGDYEAIDIYMNDIWKYLPDDICFEIIKLINSIDLNVSFKIPPKKLVFDRNFEFRNEIVYDTESMTLWDFSDPLGPVINKGIKFSQFRNPDLYIFNMEWEPYTREIPGLIDPIELRSHIVINKKVKFN